MGVARLVTSIYIYIVPRVSIAEFGTVVVEFEDEVDDVDSE